MKTNELWDTAIWLVNILLALGIMAFSFLYILFPSPRIEGAIDPNAITGPESDAVEGPASKEIAHYRPAWDAKLTNPAPPPPVVNVVTPDKVYDFVGNLMGAAVVTNKSTGAQVQFKVGASTPEGFSVLELTNTAVTMGYKDGQGKPAQMTLSLLKEGAGAGGGASRAPAAAPGPTAAPGGAGATAAPTAAAPAGGEGAITIDPADPKHVVIATTERDWMAGNQEAVLAEIKQRPYIPEGTQMRGMLLEEVKPGGRVARMGLKVNDVVRKVNGVALDTHDKWRELLQDETLRKQANVVVEIERAGQSLELRFEVR